MRSEEETILPLRRKTIVIVVTSVAFAIMLAACSVDGDSSFSQTSIPQGGSGADASLVSVPDMRGYPIEALELEFSNLGFTPSLVMLISDEPEGTVLAIRRTGQLAPVPSDIEVLVSAGPPDWDPDAPREDASESGSSAQRRYERMEFGGITWLVLEEEEDKVFLLSQFVLFDLRYNDQLISTTWETSTLRSYLNNEFFLSFSPEDRERIAETRVINYERLYTHAFGETGLGIQEWPVPAGNDTYDRIFLLSYDEQKNYFENETARLARVIDGHPNQFTGYTHWWWWLRSPGSCTFTASGISVYGDDILGWPVTLEIGIRPALWLYLNP